MKEGEMEEEERGKGGRGEGRDTRLRITPAFIYYHDVKIKQLRPMAPKHSSYSA